MENPSNSLEVERLQRLYEQLELDADERVNANEINAFLQNLGMEAVPMHEIQDIVARFSSSNACSLSFDEFVAFCKNFLSIESGFESEEEKEEEEATMLKDAFNVYDTNGDGFICAEELQRVLESLGFWQHDDQYYGVADCQNMICRYDRNCDGLLDFSEFRSMMMMNIGAC